MKPEPRSLEQLNTLKMNGVIPSTEVVSLSPITIDIKTIEEWKRDILKITELIREMVCAGKLDQYISSQNLKLVKQAITRSKRYPPIIRPDAIITDGQLKLLEINVDSAIGGLYETEQVQSLVSNHIDEALHLINTNPMDALKNYVLDLWKKEISSDYLNLAIISFDDITEYKKHILDYTCSCLKQLIGVNARFIDYKTLKVDEYVSDDSMNYQVLYRYGSLLRSPENMIDMISLLEKSHNSKTIIISDNIDLGIEQKASLALLSEHSHDDSFLSASEQALVDKYVPWTRFVENREYNFKNSQYTLDELITKEKNNLVLKRCNSHIGGHVFIGSEFTTSEFIEKIKFALTDRSYWVLQENMLSDKFNFNFFDDQTGQAFSKDLGAVICPFIFGEYYGSSLVRVELEPESRVLVVPNNSKTGLASLYGIG